MSAKNDSCIGGRKLKIRYVAIGGAISIILGIGVSILSIEETYYGYEPTEHPLNQDTPIITDVGKTTTPAGNYMIVAGIVVLLGCGVYYLFSFVKRKIGQHT